MDEKWIDEIKATSRKLTDDNIISPTDRDYFLFEMAMLKGASIAYHSFLSMVLQTNKKEQK